MLGEMVLVVEVEAEAAWSQAEKNGILVVPYEAQFAEEEWSELIDRWIASAVASGRAGVVLFAEQCGMRATVHFVGTGLPCFAKDRLDAAMGRLLEDVVDGNGFANGEFADWRSTRLPFAKAVAVAEKARELDRFARDPKGADAFEGGALDILVWDVHEL